MGFNDLPKDIAIVICNNLPGAGGPTCDYSSFPYLPDLFQPSEEECLKGHSIALRVEKR